MHLIQFFIQFCVMRAQTQLSMPPAAPTSRVLQELGNIPISTNEVPCRKNVQFVWLHNIQHVHEQTFGLITSNRSRVRSKITDSHLYDVLGISTTRLSSIWLDSNSSVPVPNITIPIRMSKIY